MANYTILHSLVQGAPSAVTVAPTPPSLASQTSASITSAYYTQGTVVADTLLGNAAIITRLQGLGAIQ